MCSSLNVSQSKMAVEFFQAGVMGEPWGKGVSDRLDHWVDWGGREVKMGGQCIGRRRMTEVREESGSPHD